MLIIWWYFPIGQFEHCPFSIGQFEHWNNMLQVDRYLHWDTLLGFPANQLLLLIFNAECLEKKQQIPIL